MCTRSVRFVPLLFAAVFAAFAQQHEVPDRQITLDVVVTNKSGKAVPGLTEKDFSLLDNKQPQKILSFAAVNGGASAPPVEAVIVFDQVNTGFRPSSYAREEVDKFLRGNGGELPLPVSLAVLTDAGIAAGNAATRDGKVLAASLDQSGIGLRAINRDQGVYGAGDRLDLSLRALAQLADHEAAVPGRKLVLWIGSGWPLLTGPEIQLSDKNRKTIFNQIVAMSDALGHAQITLYSIDPLGTADAGTARTFYYEEFLKGVKKPSQAQMGNLAVQVLSVQSGGRVFNSSNNIAGEVTNALADAASYYVITFEGLRGDGPNEYHALDLKLDERGLTAHTRTGYYAQP